MALPSNPRIISNAMTNRIFRSSLVTGKGMFIGQVAWYFQISHLAEAHPLIGPTVDWKIRGRKVDRHGG